MLTESLQMRSAPLYDAVVVTGELAGKGVTCKVRKAGEAGQLFAQQVSNPLISVAAGAERGGMSYAIEGAGCGGPDSATVSEAAEAGRGWRNHALGSG